VKSRDLIQALIAVLGVYELLQGLHLLPFLIQQAGHEGSFAMAAGVVVPFVLGVLLIALRGLLAERLASPDGGSLHGESGELLETLLAVAGVYFVVSSLATAAALATGEYLRADIRRELFATPARADEVWPPWIRVLVELSLGVGLAVGSRGIAALLRSMRAAGRPTTPGAP
jgi:hypothetical protein